MRPVRRMRELCLWGSTGTARHAQDVALEGHEAFLEGDRNRAVAHEQHGAFGERGPKTCLPLFVSLSRTKPGIPRSDASVSDTASSAVLASCTPRALHKITPGEMWWAGSSTPADKAWTTRRDGIRLKSATAASVEP